MWYITTAVMFSSLVKSHSLKSLYRQKKQVIIIKRELIFKEVITINFDYISPLF